jgi:hypothetical protein
MNCDKCQELLSDFLDGALSDADHATFGAHLEECLSCYNDHRELDSIVSFCRDHRGEYDAPPNERALWLRIVNTIESQPIARRQPMAAKTAGANRAFGWLSGLRNRHWELSLPQMAGAVAVIAIAVSLLTIFGLRSTRMGGNATEAQASNTQGSSSTLAATGNINDRLKQQQQTIEYWNQRVEQRKALWSPHMREAFERNLKMIDQAVLAHLDELKRNPNDEISEEMLNNALNEKMDLLKEFSDL